MLQRQTVVQAAHNKIQRFSCNIRPENVRERHADEIVDAKLYIYRYFLQELNRELNDSDRAEELIHEASAADVFEHLLAKISAEQEALHDISRALMNSYQRDAVQQNAAQRDDAPCPTEASVVTSG